MADNAVFEEVLAINIDTDKFSRDLDKIAEIYKAKVGELPPPGTGAGDMTAAVKKLETAITQLGTGGTEVLTKLSDTMLESAGVIEAKVGQMSTSMTAALAKVNAALGEVGAGGKRAAGSIQEAQSPIQNFFGGLTSNLAASIGGIIKFAVVWNILKAAVDAVVSVISLPFKAVADGLKYLEDFQERSSQLRAALLQNITYSKDWSKNIELASSAADILTRKVEDLAAKLQVKAPIIQTAFESFLDFGGRNLVKSTDEALNVGGLTAAALQATNPNINTRKVVSEVQDLVAGTVKESSKLASVLGLSANQLNQMSRDARTTHDLFERMVEKAPGLVERLESANQRFGSLSDALGLFVKRFEGFIAGPILQTLISYMRQTLDFLNAHSDQIEAIGRAFGQVISNVVTLVGFFTGLTTSGVTFKDVLELALGFMKGLAIGTITITTEMLKAVAVTKAFVEILAGGAIALAKAALHPTDADEILDVATFKAEKRAKDLQAQLKDLNTEAAKSIASIVYPSKTPLPEGTPNPRPEGSAEGTARLKQEESDYRKELAATTLEFQKQRDAEQEAVASRKTSHAEAAVVINDLYQKELKAIDDLVAKYKALAEASGAKPAQTAAFVAKLSEERGVIEKQAEAARSAGQKAANTEEEDIQKAHYNFLISLTRQRYQEELALAQQHFRDGFITEVQLQDARKKALDAEHQQAVEDAVDELQRTGENTKEHAEALDKLRLLNQKYTADVLALSNDRIAAVHKESLETIKAAQDELKARNDLLAQQVAFENQFATTQAQRVRNQRELLKARQDEITLAIRAAEAELALARAKNGETEQTKKLEQELRKLKLERTQNTLSQVSNAGSGTQNQRANTRAANNEFQKQLEAAEAAFDTALDEFNKYAATLPPVTERTKDQTDKLDDLKQATDDAKDALDGLANTQAPKDNTAGDDVVDSLFGSDFRDRWAAAGDDMVSKTEAIGSGLSNAFQVITGAIAQYQQGSKQGGVLGGIGSLLSSGPVSDLLQKIPVVGAFVPLIGGALSFIGGLFTAAAKRIAEKIQKETQAILQGFKDGQTNLTQTISALQAERASAISQLSGQKGGQDQLDKILPEIDKQIKELQQQADQIKKDFESQLTVLRLHSEELGNFLKQWQDINKQVKDYLGAGGSVAKANEFLKLSLQKLRQGAVDELNSGEKDAIDDALQLNDLLEQRIKLIDEEKKAEFDIINKDAVERRQSNAVEAGRELQQKRDEFNKQLADLDSQISLETVKVAKEREVFNLATDTAALKARSNELELISLDEQIAKWKDLQTLVAGILPGGTLSDSLLILLGLKPPTTTNTGLGGGGGQHNNKFNVDDLLRRVAPNGTSGTLNGNGGFVLGPGIAPTIATPSFSAPAQAIITNDGTQIQSLNVYVTNSDNPEVIVNGIEAELKKRTRFGLRPVINNSF
jgi:hypothetical protein